MKPSKLRSAAALAFAVAVMTSSCSIFSVKNEVAIDEVPVSLVFGAKVDKPPDFAPPPAFVDPDLGFPDLRGNIKPPPPPPDDPIEICAPFPTAPGARNPSPPSMKRGRQDAENPLERGNEPFEGLYFWGFQGNFNDEAVDRFALDYREITQVELEGNGFSYYMSDPFSGIFFHFYVEPEVEGAPEPTYGFFLKRIDFPSADYKGPHHLVDPEKPSQGYQDPADYRLAFIPTQPMKLSGFPFQPGTVTTSSGADVAFKENVPLPVDPGQVVPQPTGNTIISRLTMGKREIVEVCADLAQAWLVTWDLRITGDFEHRMIGTFWLDTAYGGWPVKDDFILTGDLLNGTFASNMFRLDPGKVL